ncbi:MAG: PhnD/SsuA/transferrin family substrate-binding protein [Gammaproteobacteria bacterium]|nr:PhnD/SsuA/transferrin family substrate-binding protein [Gammaproteobacteria bacterium]
MKHLLNKIVVIFLFITPVSVYSENSYIVTSPPRETLEDGKKQYVPIAELLTKVTGDTFTYKHPGDWLSYTKNMKSDYYDVVLDGPHFISWRMKMLEHTPVVRFSGSLKFMVLVNKGSTVGTLDELGGYPICALAPPNMATLSIQNQFDNPMRQPLILEVTDFKSGFKGMLAGKCQAAILPVGVYKRMNKDGKIDEKAKIIFRSTPIPQQGFSVSQRISPELRSQISDALMSEDGHAATAVVRKRFGGSKDLMTTNLEEYQGYFRYLRDFWGFDIPGAEIEADLDIASEAVELTSPEPGKESAVQQ